MLHAVVIAIMDVVVTALADAQKLVLIVLEHALEDAVLNALVVVILNAVAVLSHVLQGVVLRVILNVQQLVLHHV